MRSFRDHPIGQENKDASPSWNHVANVAMITWKVILKYKLVRQIVFN